jgi:hypothetical protein
MARVGKELLQISGSLANLVFYQRYGVNCVRMKPSHFHDAKTEKQLIARGRFAGCNRFYDQMTMPLFRHIWKTVAQDTGKNAKNLFVKHNLYAFGKEGEIVNYDRLHFSMGLLPQPDGLQFERYNGRDCRLQWVYDPAQALGSPKDCLYVVEYQSVHNCLIHKTDVSRRKGEALFSTSNDITDETHLYCFWGNEEGSAFSDSMHIVVSNL